MLTPLRKFTTDTPKPKKMRQYQESVDQKAVVKWLRERPDWMVIRCENAAKRTPSQAARDKALGMEPGAPDLFLIHKRWPVFLEMKSIGGVVSEAQTAVHNELAHRGMCVLVAFGSEDAIRQLEEIENDPSQALEMTNPSGGGSIRA
jgi:hypothetical protein